MFIKEAELLPLAPNNLISSGLNDLKSKYFSMQSSEMGIGRKF